MTMTDLLGDILLGDALLGGLDGGGADFPSDLAEFGPDIGALFSLHDQVQIFVEHIDDGGVECEILQHNVVRDDGVVVVHRYDRGQVITIRGWIQPTGTDALFNYMDTVKKNLRHINGNLYIKKAGWTYHRRYVATLMSFKEVFAGHEPWMTDWCPFVMRFFARGYGTDMSYTSAVESLTASPTTKTVENDGTADSPCVAILVFDAATNVSAVQFKNDDTGEYVTLTSAVVAGDVVKFDGENKEVYLNGVAQTYSGTFPKLPVGESDLRFTITGDSFTATATVKWKAPYR